MKTFLISDTHFGHANILTFTDNNGKLIRPGFNNVEEMNEHLIDRWNSVVSPEDKIYHLGDVGFKSFSTLSKVLERLNGTKVLIKGNHDNLKPLQYLQYFKDIRATHQLDKFILSHIPLHEGSLSRWKGNIHGHLHNNAIDDPRYFNVSVERLINYTPIDFEEVREIMYENC